MDIIHVYAKYDKIEAFEKKIEVLEAENAILKETNNNMQPKHSWQEIYADFSRFI